VIADPGGSDARGEVTEVAQVSAIERVNTADVHADPVENDRVKVGDGVEVEQVLPASDHEIFADALEPIDGRSLGEDMAVMPGAKADADAEIRAVRGVHGAAGERKVDPGERVQAGR
jgi:hypothetical protein